jgi:hypothetical protein
MSTTRKLLTVGVAAAIVLALPLAWMLLGGDDSASGGTSATGVGQVRAGSVAQLAQCSDWNSGGPADRFTTIADIDDQVNQAGADGPTPDLPEDEAYELFERACAPAYAAGFRLYKLYIRAGAFGQLVN